MIIEINGLIPGGILYSIETALIVIITAIAIYFLLDYVFGRIIKVFIKLSRKGDVENARFIFRIILAVIILSAIAYVYGQYLIVGALLIIVAVILIIGMRPIIEEYFTGKISRLIRDYSLDIGDHVEVMGIKGYVIKQTSLGLVIRNSRNELIYVPYTLLMKNMIRKVSPTEGIEVRIPFKVPKDGVLIDDLREELNEYMKDQGIEDPHVDIAAIEDKYVELIARGIYKDLRTIDDVKYSILNKAFELFAKNKERYGSVENNE
ncbi:MAG: mechanosensitive ion channel domain-containing protein [Vulcanisaeta sp. AZ3]|jgi:small-conductance mechanosensitive channel|nr:MAG: mechanosensitive ion channel protein MscS [Vulcanisaeta sp. AZ3]